MSRGSVLNLDSADECIPLYDCACRKRYKKGSETEANGEGTVSSETVRQLKPSDRLLLA